MAHTQTLPQNRSNDDKVVITGTVVGTLKDNFYTEGVAKNGMKYNRINFGVNVGTEEQPLTVYVELFGMERKSVYIHRPAGVGEHKGETKDIPWSSRNNVPSGYRLLGIGVGLTKDNEGKNAYSNMVEFDANQKMAGLLKDGMGVRVNAKIDLNRFVNKSGEAVTTVRYQINSIGLFDTEAYSIPEPNWCQNLIVTGIDREEDGSKFDITVAKVGYNSLGYFTVYTKVERLATSIKKALKKGVFACNLWGVISIEPIKEDTVETVDEWGEPNTTKHLASNSFTRELLVTGCDGVNADYETYTEENLSEFKQELDAREQANKTFEGTPAPSPKTAKPAKNEDDDWGTPISSDDLPF